MTANATARHTFVTAAAAAKPAQAVAAVAYAAVADVVAVAAVDAAVDAAVVAVAAVAAVAAHAAHAAHGAHGAHAAAAAADVQTASAAPPVAIVAKAVAAVSNLKARNPLSLTLFGLTNVCGVCVSEQRRLEPAASEDLRTPSSAGRDGHMCPLDSPTAAIAYSEGALPARRDVPRQISEACRPR